MLPSVHFSSLTLSLFLLTALFLNPTFAHNKPSPTPAFIAPISTPDFVATARIRPFPLKPSKPAKLSSHRSLKPPLPHLLAPADPLETPSHPCLLQSLPSTAAHPSLSNLSPCAISCLKNVPPFSLSSYQGKSTDAVATDALKGCTSSCGEVAFLPILLGYCRSTSPSDAPLATTRAVVRVVSASKSSVRLDVMGTVLAVVSALLLI
ncbi:hypothetical protein BC829DRAFT_487649 [Chytridium lagenaria]|nr:hypothetical protein BC829DRAFT_487649 [Chytridium lagenaria]